MCAQTDVDRLSWWFPSSARSIGVSIIGERFEATLEGAAAITSEGYYVRPVSPRVLTAAGTVVEKKQGHVISSPISSV